MAGNCPPCDSNGNQAKNVGHKCIVGRGGRREVVGRFSIFRFSPEKREFPGPASPHCSGVRRVPALPRTNPESPSHGEPEGVRNPPLRPSGRWRWRVKVNPRHANFQQNPKAPPFENFGMLKIRLSSFSPTKCGTQALVLHFVGAGLSLHRT